MPEDLDKIKRDILARLDIRAEYEALGIRFVGNPSAKGWLACHNPYKKDDVPSCGVNISQGPSRGYLMPFNMSNSGRPHYAISFWDIVRDFGDLGTEFKSILKHYSEKTGINLSGKSSRPPTSDMVENYVSQLSEDVIDFLKRKRGLSDESTRKYQLGWDKKRERITFPVYDDQRKLVNIRYYSSEKKPKMLNHRGYGQARLWGVERLAKADPGSTVCVTEGEFDSILLEQETGLIAVSPTNGAKSFLQDWVKFFHGHHVVLVWDCDDEGRQAVNRLVLPAFKKVVQCGDVLSIKVIWLFEDSKNKDRKDFTDFIVKAGGTGAQLLDLIKNTGPHGYQQPPYEIDAGNLNMAEVSAAAWEALDAANNPHRFFIHPTGLVRLEHDEERGLIPNPLTEDRLRHEMARVAFWFTSRKDGSIEPALPPMHVIKDMLADPAPVLPYLSRIVEHPIFATDKSIQIDPGYSPKTQCLFGKSRDFHIPNVPLKPTQTDLQRARHLIDDLLGDFPFVHESEKAHAIGMMIQPFVRELISGPTPLYLIEAPCSGSGKTLCAHATCFPAIGRTVPSMTEGKDEDEWRKRITSLLRIGPTFMLIDNVQYRLASSALASAITSTVWEDRMLGRSEMIRLPIRCGWIVTANNPALSSEIARRTVRIRLDPKMDRPWTRDPKKFRHPDLLGWARENRGELIGATLILTQAWVAEGCPEPTDITILGMFEDWSRVIGGIIQVAGIPGFLSNLDEFYEESDAEGAILRTLVSAWWEKYRQEEIGVSDLLELVQEDDIPLDLGKGKELSQKTRLGKLLSKLRDRQFENYCVKRGKLFRNAYRWKLVPAHIQSVKVEVDATLTQPHTDPHTPKCSESQENVRVCEGGDLFPYITHARKCENTQEIQENVHKNPYREVVGFTSPPSHGPKNNKENQEVSQCEGSQTLTPPSSDKDEEICEWDL